MCIPNNNSPYMFINMQGRPMFSNTELFLVNQIDPNCLYLIDQFFLGFFIGIIISYFI